MGIRHYYKTEAPAIVVLVQEFYMQRDQQQAALVILGEAFGGTVAHMRDITSHFAGGVKFKSGQDRDVHWRRPDEFGYRSLRVKAVPPKGVDKETRAAIKVEHDRLLALWTQLCPPRLSAHGYWEQIGINTGNLMLSGGVKFELDGVAYFNLGFPIAQDEHLKSVAEKQPSYGWIEGAVEITASEYEAARIAREHAFAAAKEVAND